MLLKYSYPFLIYFEFNIKYNVYYIDFINMKIKNFFHLFLLLIYIYIFWYNKIFFLFNSIMYRVKDDGFILNALYKYNIYIRIQEKKIVSVIVLLLVIWWQTIERKKKQYWTNDYKC